MANDYQSSASPGQPNGENAESQATSSGQAERLRWLREARLGMFIHWGLYSMPARHEWVKQRERLDDASYDRYFKHFDPDLFDPEVWARHAARAGMKYVVVTTKHHEGFCLWDSGLTDYKATNTPARRDLLRPIIDAFRAEGLRIGLYHSLLDWHHPDFPIDGMHPQRDDAAAIAAARDRDVTKYADYLHGQVEELLTQFGRIDYLWFDFSYPQRVWGGKGRKDWRSEELLAKARKLQPDVIVNDRLDIPGDVTTPEQYQPAAPMAGDEGLWEACQTLNGSWGYDRDNLDWKPVDMLVRMLADGVSKGGNLLLNVGATPAASSSLAPCRYSERWASGRRCMAVPFTGPGPRSLCRPPTAASPRPVTGCTSTCSPGPLVTYTSVVWLAGSSTHSCCTTVLRSGWR